MMNKKRISLTTCGNYVNNLGPIQMLSFSYDIFSCETLIVASITKSKYSQLFPESHVFNTQCLVAVL